MLESDKRRIADALWVLDQYLWNGMKDDISDILQEYGMSFTELQNVVSAMKDLYNK